MSALKATTLPPSLPFRVPTIPVLATLSTPIPIFFSSSSTLFPVRISSQPRYGFL